MLSINTFDGSNNSDFPWALDKVKATWHGLYNQLVHKQCA